jgi:isopentenyl diphosphate isomerase/L-lactate dehydrogenase-like FMN-dependent dehydrogenase
LHLEDAARAASTGVDGVIVSNHGGRTFDGAPASIDMLPAVVQSLGRRLTVLFDSGIRSGLDIARALALGAHAAFVGRPFLFGLAAVGSKGAQFLADMMIEELLGQFASLGSRSVKEISKTQARHPTAWRLDLSTFDGSATKR